MAMKRSLVIQATSDKNLGVKINRDREENWKKKKKKKERFIDMRLFKEDQALPVAEKSNWWPENNIRLRNMRLVGPPEAQTGDTEIYF